MNNFFSNKYRDCYTDMIINMQEGVDKHLMQLNPPPSPSDVAGWTSNADEPMDITIELDRSESKMDITIELDDSTKSSVLIPLNSPEHDESCAQMCNPIGFSTPLKSSHVLTTPLKSDQVTLSEFKRQNDESVIILGSSSEFSDEVNKGSYLGYLPNSPEPLPVYRNPMKGALRRIHLKNTLAIQPKILTFSPSIDLDESQIKQEDLSLSVQHNDTTSINTQSTSDRDSDSDSDTISLPLPSPRSLLTEQRMLFDCLRDTFEDYLRDNALYDPLRRAIYTINHHTARMIIFYYLYCFHPQVWKRDFIESVTVNMMYLDRSRWSGLNFSDMEIEYMGWIQSPYDLIPNFSRTRQYLYDMLGNHPAYSPTGSEYSCSDYGGSVNTTFTSVETAYSGWSSPTPGTPLTARIEHLLHTVRTCRINPFISMNPSPPLSEDVDSSCSTIEIEISNGCIWISDTSDTSDTSDIESSVSSTQSLLNDQFSANDQNSHNSVSDSDSDSEQDYPLNHLPFKKRKYE